MTSTETVRNISSQSDEMMTNVSSRSDGTNETLSKMLSKYKGIVMEVFNTDGSELDGEGLIAMEMCRLVSIVRKNEKNNDAHCTLKSFIEKNKIKDELIDAYLMEFEEYMYTESYSTKEWKNANGNHHRIGGPAIIYKSGGQSWYENGVRHRVEKDAEGKTLPAVIDKHGNMEWYFEGKQHRDDVDENGLTLPAEITKNSKTWYKNGKQHRSDTIVVEGRIMTLPSYEGQTGTKRWYQYGQLRRTDMDEYGNLLPTEISDCGTMFWNKNGKQHRAELGKNPNDPKTFGKALPAIIWGINKREDFIYEGKGISQEELTERILKQECPFNEATEIHIKMKNGSVVKIRGSFESVSSLRC
jgi:hypothetical protein